MNKDRLRKVPVLGVLALAGAVSALFVVDACGGDSSPTDSGVHDAAQDGGACAASQTLCPSGCVDEMTDNAHCGSCNNACVSGTYCNGGTCQTDCAAEMKCDTVCVDKMNDNSNCGTCGKVCSSGTHCESGHCTLVCPDPSTTFCSGTCAILSMDKTHCGSCANSCGSTGECGFGTCFLASDVMPGAIEIPIVPGAGDSTHPGTTLHATPSAVGVEPSVDTIACGALSGRNVWYAFTLVQTELVYADTLDTTTLDTQLFFADSAGAPLTTGGTVCSDNACGGMGGQIAAQLGAGTYYIVVSSVEPADGGDFTLHFQHLSYVPEQDYSSTNSGIGGMGSVAGTFNADMVHHGQPSCLNGGGNTDGGNTDGGNSDAGFLSTKIGENAYWLFSCGSEPSVLSLCQAHNGAWQYTVTDGGGLNSTHNPVMALISGSTGVETQCNNDVSSCAATDSDNSYGSEINATLPRGLHVVTISDISDTSGMPYTLGYDIH